MLAEFRIRNFRSLRDEQVFSMVSTTDRTQLDTHTVETGVRALPRLNRAGVIYGANASGKSNLLFGLLTMRHFVLHAGGLLDAARAELYTPYRLTRASAGSATEFEVTVVIDGVRYQYGFGYDAERVTTEYLTVYRTAKGQTWFDRRWDTERGDYVWAPFSGYFTGAKETWRQATRPGALFLSTAIQLNNAQMKPLWYWFLEGIGSINAGGNLDLVPTLLRLEEPAFKARALRLLQRADLHVADLEIDNVPGHQVSLHFEPGKSPEASVNARTLPDVRFVHQVSGEDPVAFDRRFESAGTQRLLSYAAPVLEALDHGKLLVVDELDASLHPLVVRFLLSLFHDPAESPHGAQLIMTTHDTILLGEDALRRDEIWFVEKDPEQASRLYPLTDYSPRKGEAIEKGYLRARYGALPFISGLSLH